MRVSEFFDLGRTQPTLDFVDVDTRNDVRVFVNPRALLLLQSDWADGALALIRDYFGALLEAIKKDRTRRAQVLLEAMSEPDETHLGLSAGESQGRGVGAKRARMLWKALSKSEAVRTGLVKDLEDTGLMVEGIGPDLVSDITTCVLREPLIEYTQAACEVYGIPMEEDVYSGALWSPQRKEWFAKYVSLPVTQSGRLLLVPKSIVRRRLDYDPGEYYRHYLLEELRDDELAANSALVEVLLNGRRRVTKKALREKYGTGKQVIVEQTLKHPEALRRYRDDKHLPEPPMDHAALSQDPPYDLPDWDALLTGVTSLRRGKASAKAYEEAVADLMQALFYPSLTDPKRQTRIHAGRKIIDITFSNVAREGFFHWVGMHFPAAQIIVECKNYNGELKNPELDQIAGRFAPNRGRVGLLVCRSLEDKEKFIARCRDTAMEDRGFIIPLDDADLGQLVRQRQVLHAGLEYPLLRGRFDRLVN